MVNKLFLIFVFVTTIFTNIIADTVLFSSFVKNKDVQSINNGKEVRVTYTPNLNGSPRIVAYHPFSSKFANNISVSYDVMFEEGFEWARGGKLHGIRGGDLSIEASGCVPANPNAWSARAIWRKNAAVELYLYDQSRSDNGNQCGNSYISKPGILPINEWFKVTLEVVLNTQNQPNGIGRLYINNKLIIEKTDVKWRGVISGATINHFSFSTFYGGNDPSWAPTKNTYAKFKNLQWDLIKSNTGYYKCGVCIK